MVEKPAETFTEGKPCCGSKGKRHKKECRLNDSDGSLPPDDEPDGEKIKWSCIDCSTVTEAVEKPKECDQCGSRSFVQKPY